MSRLPTPEAIPVGGRPAGRSAVELNLDYSTALDSVGINQAVTIVLGASIVVELPEPEPGAWVIVQNGSPTSSTYTLTIEPGNLWPDSPTPPIVLAAGDFVSYSAMLRDGLWLWRDMAP